MVPMEGRQTAHSPYGKPRSAADATPPSAASSRVECTVALPDPTHNVCSVSATGRHKRLNVCARHGVAWSVVVETVVCIVSDMFVWSV